MDMQKNKIKYGFYTISIISFVWLAAICSRMAGEIKNLKAKIGEHEIQLRILDELGRANAFNSIVSGGAMNGGPMPEKIPPSLQPPASAEKPLVQNNLNQNPSGDEEKIRKKIDFNELTKKTATDQMSIIVSELKRRDNFLPNGKAKNPAYIKRLNSQLAKITGKVPGDF